MLIRFRHQHVGWIGLVLTLVIAACQPITRPPEMPGEVTGVSTEPPATTPCNPTPFFTSAPQPAVYPELPATITLPRTDEPGERLVVTGVVYAEDCVTPLAGTLLEVWQANAAGEYTYLAGQLLTDAQGRYQINTIKPEMYGPPPHIHFRIAHPAVQPIETELLFVGEGDTQAIANVAITALTTEASADGPRLRATFDIVLQRRP